jgi:hypothetical protein
LDDGNDDVRGTIDGAQTPDLGCDMLDVKVPIHSRLELTAEGLLDRVSVGGGVNDKECGLAGIEGVWPRGIDEQPGIGLNALLTDLLIEISATHETVDGSAERHKRIKRANADKTEDSHVEIISREPRLGKKPECGLCWPLVLKQ